MGQGSWTNVVSKIKLDRIFVLAILFSVVWHLFWLTAVKVVITPGKMKQATFSRVSFLGPILERGAMEVRIERPQSSVLEKRYMEDLEEIRVDVGTFRAGRPAVGEDDTKDAFGSSAKRLHPLIIDAVSGTKAEPNFHIE
ncbi:MAG: hypothetical protein PHP46_00845 [Candidatus Omnitrophica bacterium]|nr:hypothetical protein [Candidatus Omnitrophota bacterium]